MYYTDNRFDGQFGSKSTDDLKEGKSNPYYLDSRVSDNANVKANTDYRGIEHLPLSGGIMTGEITWDTEIEIPTWSSDTAYTPSDDPNWSISSSSIYDSNYRTFEAFNKTVYANGLDCWISAAGRYSSTGLTGSGTYSTTQVDGNNSYRGEWIQIRYTRRLRLTSFVLTARSKHAEYSKSYRLLGTNDDPNANPSSLSWTSPGT